MVPVPSGQTRQRTLAIGSLIFQVKKRTGRGRLFLLAQLFAGLLGEGPVLRREKVSGGSLHGIYHLVMTNIAMENPL